MTNSIVKITCQLRLPSSFMHHNIGSLLHGVLMERLSAETAAQLHAYRYNPVKQRLWVKDAAAFWEVVCLESVIGGELVHLFTSLAEIEIKRHGVVAPINDVVVQYENYNDLVAQHMTNPSPKSIIKCIFLSPTGFKSDGDYDIFPDVKKFLRSVMLNFDYFSPETKIYDYDALNYLTGQVKIIDYRLNSTRFGLEGVKIPAFKGQIVLKLRGNLQTIQLLNLIFSFAELSGVGIKTSLGMGYVRVEV